MSTYPPDGYQLAGTGYAWSTDIDVSTSVYNSGDVSIEFKNTTPASDPGITTVDLIPVEPGIPYLFTAVLRASSVAAGNILTAGLDFTNAAGTYTSSILALNGSVLSAADTWLEYSTIAVCPAGSYFCKPRVAKAKTAFTVYLDSMIVRRTPRSCYTYQNAATAQSINDSAWTKVTLDTETYDYGAIFDSSVNSRFTAPRTGIYSADWSGAIISIADAKIWQTALYKNGAIIKYGTTCVVGAASTPCSSGSVAALYLAKGDYLELYCYHNHGVARTIGGGTDYTNFSVTEWL